MAAAQKHSRNGDNGDRHHKARSVRAYLTGVSSHYKARIGRVLRESLTSKGVGRVSGGRIPCNPKTRIALADSIFSVENDLESRHGGQPDHAAVVQMRRARNQVEIDLGWSDDEEQAAPRAGEAA